MGKYNVTATIPVFITVTVEADSKEDALDQAYDEGLYLSGYCGNGGSDKLVGTSGSNVSVEAGEIPLEGEFTGKESFKIEVKKVEE